MNVQSPKDKLQAKDYATDQEVRWCPGCGDYAIVKAMQNTMAEIEAKPENTVWDWVRRSFSLLYGYLWFSYYSWKSSSHRHGH